MSSENCPCYGRCHHCEMDAIEMTVQCETDTLSDSDRRIKACKRDIHHALKEGCFQIETPRVTMGQDAIHGLTIGWSRDRKFARGCSRGPMQFDLEFGAFGKEDEMRFYEDLETDMRLMEPKVILHGSLHVWEMDTPHHDISIGPFSTHEPLEIFADLHWLDADPFDWR